MKIVAIVGQKGGTGKTTVTLSLAVAAVKDKRSVAVIDLDPQPSATEWHDVRKANGIDENTPAVVSAQASRLSQILDAAKSGGVDIAFIDTPGKSEAALIEAARLADLVLIPVRPQMFDLGTLRRIGDVLRSAGNPKTAVLLNAVPIQGKRHEEAKSVIEHHGFDIVPVFLHYRASYSDAPTLGQMPTEYEPKGKAAIEIKQLYEYTCIQVYGKKRK